MKQKRRPLASGRHHALHKHSELRKPIDVVILVTAIAQPLITLPQVFVIFGSHAAVGVSLLTWGGYEVFAATWLIYGIVHRLKPIMVTECLWILVQGAVIIGILRYG